MYVIRPTQPLLRKLGIRPPGIPVVSTTALGDWFIRPHNVGRHRLLLCTSSKSLLTALVPARDLPGVGGRLREAVADLLFALGAPLGAVNRELAAMGDVVFDASNDRRVLGSMTDMARMADAHLGDGASAEHLVVVGMRLAQAPCGPLDFDTPLQVALALLKECAAPSSLASRRVEEARVERLNHLDATIGGSGYLLPEQSMERVSIDALVDGLQMQSDQLHVFLHRSSGRILPLSDEALAAAENEDEDRVTPEELAQARDVLGAEDEYLALPDRFEIDEYRMMERFAGGLADEEHRGAALTALRGRGAFRYFKDTVHRLGLAEAWYAYRDDAYRDLARDWCKANQVDFDEPRAR